MSDTTDPPLLLNLHDYQLAAKRKLSKALYEYIASGTASEQTLAENVQSYSNWYLQPRVMRPIDKIDTSISLFGCRYYMPLFTSPAGVQALCDPSEGECATARACGKYKIPFGLSQHATRSIEQVASATGGTTSLFYQVYILKDRSITVDLIQRAVKQQYKAIILTVDSVVFGFREADARNGWDSLPPPHRLVNYDKYTDNSYSKNNDNSSDNVIGSAKLEQTYNARTHKSWDQNSEQMFDTNLSWDDVKWVKQVVAKACHDNNNTDTLPLIVKGIMTPQDAILAIEHGANAIMVSNHGGRQLDGCLSAIDALPAIVSATRCYKGIPILLDGGIRRGTDILKALALGATAVGIGKPVFFALAVNGQAGVEHTLSILQKELQSAMALCGCRSIENDVIGNINLVTRRPFSIQSAL